MVALCFLFLSRNLFLYFFYIQILYGLRSIFRQKMEPCKPLKPATVFSTVRFDRSSSGFMHFSHREVLRGKRTEMMRGSQLTGSDSTVRSRSENHDKSSNLLNSNLREIETIRRKKKILLIRINI